MGKSWWKSKAEQLDLLAALTLEPSVTHTQPTVESAQAEAGSQMPVPRATCSSDTASGQPLLVPFERPCSAGSRPYAGTRHQFERGWPTGGLAFGR
jgi:hypothetical protein